MPQNSHGLSGSDHKLECSSSLIPEGHQHLTHSLITPATVGAVATVLITGDGALKVVNNIFKPISGKAFITYPHHEVVLGTFITQSDFLKMELRDTPCASSEFSSSREKIVAIHWDDYSVELHSHGSLAAVQRICETLRDQGSLEVNPWNIMESYYHRLFTDLEQHELKEPASHPNKLHPNMRGCVFSKYTELLEKHKKTALKMLSQAPSVRIAEILWDQVTGALDHAYLRIEWLEKNQDFTQAKKYYDELDSWRPLGMHLLKPWRITLTGRVNAGKSSLINAILGYERAIVHHLQGTTRDLVSQTVILNGWWMTFTDSAGIRNASDPVECEGISRMKQACLDADLVLWVHDVSCPEMDQNELELLHALSGHRILHVWNKMDLISSSPLHVNFSLPADATNNTPEYKHWHRNVSAATGSGITELLEQIEHILIPKIPPAGTPVPLF